MTLRLTSAALRRLEESRAAARTPERFGVRVYPHVDRIGLRFVPHPRRRDVVFSHQAMTFYVAPDLVEPLDHSVIDVKPEEQGADLVVRPWNPEPVRRF